MDIAVDDIEVGPGRRKTDKEAIKVLADSIATIGLRIAITVRPKQDGKHQLITGAHRLAACRLLGWTEIPCEVMSDAIDAELWEIAENLHRKELTAMQRNLYLGRWVKLTEQKLKLQSRQVGANESHRSDRRGHRQEGGIRAAARELGVKPTTARRAVKIVKLTKAAQEEAERLGLENNQRALERAAGMPDKKNQIHSLQKSKRIKQEREATKAQIRENHRRAEAAARSDPAAEFHRWLGSFDIEMRMRVRLWLLATDLAAWFEELDRNREAIEADRRMLH
jgi:ParB-like chromosome segregation protein Spo0J